MSIAIVTSKQYHIILVDHRRGSISSPWSASSGLHRTPFQSVKVEFVQIGSAQFVGG